jgi:hypothetical protein
MLIPAKHRIDRLRELGAARFVNATSVDSDILPAISSGLGTVFLNLRVVRVRLGLALTNIVEGDLRTRPSVRKDSVVWNIGA